jgi:hypothetical protein
LRLISTDPKPTFALESKQQIPESFITEQTYTPGKKRYLIFQLHPSQDWKMRASFCKNNPPSTTGPLVLDSGIHTDSSVTTLSTPAN